MPSFPILQTKLHIPPIRPAPSSELRARLVSRPRLVERLNAGLHRKLTLISAPAGFGKTTLLAGWANDLRMANDDSRRAAPQDSRVANRKSEIANRIVWLSLDEDDNDLARFLVYVVATLSKIEANIGKGVLNQLRASPPPAEEILTFLINVIATMPGQIILVLDDYHLIEDQAVHDALAFLLARLPRQLHLVISTREDPYLSLARLRARGQLIELRATDLRFTSAEAAEFLNQVMGLALSAQDITALEARTEGWIAGLQLAALALQGTISTRGHKNVSEFIQSFTGSHRFVLDYLVEEVLERQPESIQTFLLQTAILDRLTAPLCNAVTGQDHGQATLERLDRANLFIIPLDDGRQWYRFHRLFADLLRQRLRQTHPEEIPGLYRRASEWYEQNDFSDEAIEHALRAGDLARAASLMETHADAAWRCGEHAKLRHWLDALSLEAIRAKPRLCVYHTWYLFAGGRQDEAEEALQACEEAMGASPDLTTATPVARRHLLSDLDRQTMRGRAAVIRAFIATYIGDTPAIIHHARRALDCLPEQDLTWRRDAALALGDAHGFRGDLASAYAARLEAAEASQAAGDTIFSLLAHLKVAITLREQGRLQRTIELCQEQLEFASRSGLMRTSVPGGFLAIWGEVLAELGDLEGALDLVTRGIESAERGEESLVTGWGYLCLTRVLYSRRDMAEVIAIARKVDRSARDSQIPPWIAAEVAAWKARSRLAQGKLAVVSRWARQRGLTAAGRPKQVDEFDFFSLNAFAVLARTLLARERWDEAIWLLSRLLEAAEAGERISKAIEILGLQAVAAQAKGDTSLALAMIENALALAEPEGFVQTFVDEGPPMARLLLEALGRGMAPEYVRRLLAAFPVTEPEPRGPLIAQTQVPGLVEPLSERELEVLQLVAAGLTNPEIASRLFLSVNTVKRHSYNIYGKLGVHSRTQAVARARSLGILSYP
jgi:LuxR family maltose regulon positive regulatory protein